MTAETKSTYSLKRLVGYLLAIFAILSALSLVFFVGMLSLAISGEGDVPLLGATIGVAFCMLGFVSFLKTPHTVLWREPDTLLLQSFHGSPLEFKAQEVIEVKVSWSQPTLITETGEVQLYFCPQGWDELLGRLRVANPRIDLRRAFR